MIKKTILVLTLTILTASLNAQKKISVTARGSYEARDLTIEEVKKKAIDEAKKNAMVKAGISENVKVSDFLYTFEDDEHFKEIFQSFVSTETGADIIVNDVKEINRDINEFGNILIEVEIQATIIKHRSQKDPSFQFKVEGIKEFYYDTSPLTFSFKPSKEGYLKIFNITDETAFILYPYSDPENALLNDEQGRLFKKNQTVNFPVNPNMSGYFFEIDNKEKDKEYNLLIFVYTKDDIPFMKDVNVENIMRWIYELPLDEKVVEQYGIVVRK